MQETNKTQAVYPVVISLSGLLHVELSGSVNPLNMVETSNSPNTQFTETELKQEQNVKLPEPRSTLKNRAQSKPPPNPTIPVSTGSFHSDLHFSQQQQQQKLRSQATAEQSLFDKMRGFANQREERERAMREKQKAQKCPFSLCFLPYIP